MLNGHFIYCSLSFLLFVLASAYAWQNNRSGFIPLIFQHELVLLFCILQDLFMARTNRPSDITCPCNENSTTEECSVLLLSALEYSIILSKKMMIIIYYCCCISTNNSGRAAASLNSFTYTNNNNMKIIANSNWILFGNKMRMTGMQGWRLVMISCGQQWSVFVYSCGSLQCLWQCERDTNKSHASIKQARRRRTSQNDVSNLIKFKTQQ